MPSIADEVETRKEELAVRLTAISEELADLVLETLGVAIREGQSDQIKSEEKLLARARRSVDKAAGLLRTGGSNSLSH